MTASPRREGFALIYAIWVLAILMAVVVAFAWNEQHEVFLAQRAMDTIGARYMAEAGVNLAIAEIKASWENDSAGRRLVPSNTAFGGWVGSGSRWAELGSWKAQTTLGDALQCGLSGSAFLITPPSTFTKAAVPGPGWTTTGATCYFQVAVQDESGKYNINCSDAIATRQERLKAIQNATGFPGTMMTDAECDLVGAETGHRSVQELGLILGGSMTDARKWYSNKSFLTVYPQGPRFGTNYGGPAPFGTGSINVNSAPYWVLRAVKRSSGTYLTDAEANALITERNEAYTGGGLDGPFTSSANFNTRMGYTLDDAFARYDSLGWYRIIARGVMIPKRDYPAALATGERWELADAVVECYVKASFESDAMPVQICYWQEWFAIPYVP